MSDNYNPYRRYCRLWWMYWSNLPGDILAFLRRLWDWAPLLWHDEDWDYAYLLRIMRFKVLRMRKHMEKRAIIAHAEDHTAEMAIADVLFRNVVEEDPDDEWSMHYNQWHIGLKFNEHCKAPGAACRLALNYSAKRGRRNWKKLWRHLDRYMQGWWD